MAAHGKRQAIATIRDVLAPGPIDVPNAPAGHTDCMHVGGVFLCACSNTAYLSRAALIAHHDDVRGALAQLGIKRARASVQHVTLAEIHAAYRAAGGDE